ncbi:PEP-CTERM system histidine kinase PrsK [Erythrobacter vulgaris]|uniref:histidine kinase n=1 Tax=Qipengyuania vulgaris TaxID=291985 RepID=A0A844XP37_9SPHN|nr:XrtA/PEP-CTERM system histidine kinase PrsK [Qipengyuania vulgaris]MXO46822.1 PEP-CTERM system histidine kinase PrsK [Qipengyuania vulgaris]
MDWAVSLSYLCYGIGAIVSGIAAFWIARKGADDRSDRWAGVVALIFTANWCIAAASFEFEHPVVGLTEIFANLAWIFVLFRIFANDGRDESLRLVRPVVVALVFVEMLQFALLGIEQRHPFSADVQSLVSQTSALFHVLVAVGALVLLHNLYVGAAPASRKILRWNAAAMAGFWAFTLNFYTIAYLVGSFPIELVALRGLAVMIIAVPFALGYTKSAAGLTFRPSRAVTFHFLSLLVIGAYLLLMLGLGSWLDVLSGSVARMTQVGLVIAAGALTLIWLPSARLRGWLRVTAVKHLFKHRFDYRNEWIRFTHTIGLGGPDEDSLQERAIRSLADITDSPSGLLLLVNEEGQVEQCANWRWPQMEVPANPIPSALATIFENEGLILDFDEARAGIEHQGELEHAPSWLLENLQAWAAVPLLHFDRLIGVIILARPEIERKLDWEDFDLLAIVGRQLASYLAEQASQEALSEAARFDEFNRRMAFVMHDIKNLSSQMSLLLRNAEKHAENPEFRKDMLITVRNSADKLNTMLSRLGRYAKGGQEDTGAFDMSAMVRATCERYARNHQVLLVRSEPMLVNGQADAFEQALSHIVQNAIDASVDGGAVMLESYSDGISGVVQIIDSGRGMTPTFLRNGLFKPFVSSREDGFGIGAYEAREMIRSMGGRVEVESRVDLGTRFTLSLPLQSAHELLKSSYSAERKEIA